MLDWLGRRLRLGRDGERDANAASNARAALIGRTLRGTLKSMSRYCHGCWLNGLYL